MATTATHIPAGIILGSDLLEVLTKTLPADFRTTMVLVCAQLGIQNVQMFRRATSAPDSEIFRTKFQTTAAPILRKRLFTTSLMEVVNAATRIYTALKLNPQTGTVAYPKAVSPSLKTANLTQRKMRRTART